VSAVSRDRLSIDIGPMSTDLDPLQTDNDRLAMAIGPDPIAFGRGNPPRSDVD
jgi:hypothetical protein